MKLIDEVTLLKTARQFWLLIKLRYRMLWAPARTSAGRMTILVALYALGATLFLFLNLGGIGAAAAAVQLGKGEAIARWVFTGLFVNGVLLSLALGAGPRAAFADPLLRRYPLSAGARFTARHLIGLLDPVWPLLLATGLGLAIGFASLGAGSALAGVTAALLCTLASYLAALILLSCAERSLQPDGGALILSALMLGAATAAGSLGPRLLESGGRGRWLEAFDRGLRYMPPGLAATLLAGPTLASAVASAVLLAAWCLALAIILGALERRWRIGPRAPAARPRWNGWYDRLADLFRSGLAPLVAKSLRYHLRCNRVRFNLAVAVPAVAIMMSGMGRDGIPSVSLLTNTALVALAGIIPTGVMAFNQFGCDGAGVRRYALLPTPVAAALRAGSYVSLMIGGAVLLPALAVGILYSPAPADARVVLILGSGGGAGLFFFNALGLWSSAISPRPVDLRGLRGNVLSAAANAILLGGMLALIVAAWMLGNRYLLETLLASWWVFAVLLAAAISFYVWSLRVVSQTLGAHWEKLAKTIAGASAG